MPVIVMTVVGMIAIVFILGNRLLWLYERREAAAQINGVWRLIIASVVLYGALVALYAWTTLSIQVEWIVHASLVGCMAITLAVFGACCLEVYKVWSRPLVPQHRK